MSGVHLWHSKDPPCATQALMFLSSSHIVSEVVDGVVVAGGTGDVLVLDGTTGQSVHWHLFSY